MTYSDIQIDLPEVFRLSYNVWKGSWGIVGGGGGGRGMDSLVAWRTMTDSDTQIDRSEVFRRSYDVRKGEGEGGIGGGGGGGGEMA